jgi:4-alpha-L-fucosyltransferase (fuc4NAc transferase)
MKIIKNLHIIHKDKFDKEFIEFVNSNFEKEDHFFLVIHLPNKKKYDLIEEKDSNILNFEFKNHKNMLLRKVFLAIQVIKLYIVLFFLSIKSRRIFFHSIADYQILFLYIFRNFLKKSYYAIWSTEKTKYENNHIFNKIVKYVKGNFRGYITHIRGDYEIMKERYGAKGDYLDCFTYPSNLYKEIKLSERKNISKKNLNIQVGNSAQMCNNHIEILEKLEEFRDENIRLYCILSYGNDGGDKYLNKVIENGKKIFKDKFIPVLDFFPPQEYINFLSEIDIAIFAHNTQKAFGNIVSLLSMKKTVYLKENTTTYKTLNELGLKLKSFDNLKNLELFEKEFLEKNKDIIIERFSEKRLKKDLTLIFYNDIKELK